MEKYDCDNLVKIRPELRAEGYHGVIGEAALCLCDGFRALPALVFLSLMARTIASITKGNVVVKNGAQYTELRLNGLIIMRTGGGKGLGEGRAKLLTNNAERVFTSKNLDKEYPLFAPVHSGGLSTTEGIVSELRDDAETPDGKKVIGNSDKRLCVIEEEFADIFVKSRKNGSTLSQTIRKLFDGQDLSPMTKHDRIRSTNPHVCMIGHMTPKEFLAEVKTRDLFNGFNNRFITVLGIPKAVIPFPKELDEKAIDALSTKLGEAIAWSNDERRILEMSECFKNLWVTEIYRISELGPPDSLEASLMVRAPHYALIISGLFAAMDQSCVLTEKHLRASLAWIDYWHDSVRYLFNTEAEAEENKIRQEKAEQVLNAIKEIVAESGQRTFVRTKLSQKLNRKVPSKIANRALQDLQERPVPPISVLRTGLKNGQMITLL